MASRIWAKIPNSNTAKATLIKARSDRIELRVTTAEDDVVLDTYIDTCTIRALRPLADKPGDVGIWVPELRIHLWVGCVTIEDGIAQHIEGRMEGLAILEE